MAGRFPLYTDADIRGSLVDAFKRRGWDVLRAVDAFPEGTDDDVHFEYAAELGRVMVSNDSDLRRLASEWLCQGRSFRLITWPQKQHSRMSVGEILQVFEELAAKDDPFSGYPVVYLKPKDSRR